MFSDRSDFFFFFFFFVLAQLGIEGDILTKIKKYPTSGLRGDAIISLSMGRFTKSEPGTKWPNLSVLAQLGIEANTIGKFHSNPSSSF